MVHSIKQGKSLVRINYKTTHITRVIQAIIYQKRFVNEMNLELK